MKNKYFYLTIPFIAYIIILIISNKYSMSTFFLIPIMLYAGLMIKTMAKSKKNNGNSSDEFLEESKETVSSTSYFEKKKPEEPKIQI